MNRLSISSRYAAMQASAVSLPAKDSARLKTRSQSMRASACRLLIDPSRQCSVAVVAKLAERVGDFVLDFFLVERPRQRRLLGRRGVVFLLLPAIVQNDDVQRAHALRIISRRLYVEMSVMYPSMMNVTRRLVACLLAAALQRSGARSSRRRMPGDIRAAARRVRRRRSTRRTSARSSDSTPRTRSSCRPTSRSSAARTR